MRYLIAFLLIAVPVFGQTQEQAQQCRAVMEQAKAEALLLQMPKASAQLTQSPLNGVQPQAVAGITHSLQDWRKGRLTLQAGVDACRAYSQDEDASLRIQFTVPQLEHDALENRLQLIQRSKDEFNRLLVDSAARLKAHTLTVQAQFTIQQALITAEADSATTEATTASLLIPELPGGSLRTLAQSATDAENRQNATALKLQETSAWDVAPEVGIRHQLYPFANGFQPYGGATVTYSFGAKASNQHAEESQTAFSKWRADAIGSIPYQMGLLKQTIEREIAAQKRRLAVLQQEEATTQKYLQSVQGVDTSNALQFQVQVKCADLALRVELGDTEFRVDQLTRFLAENF